MISLYEVNKLIKHETVLEPEVIASTSNSPVIKVHHLLLLSAV